MAAPRERAHHRCAEEFLLIDGELTVSGVTFAAGEFGAIRPAATRSDSGSAGGCLALAYFDGPPVWVVGPAESAPAEPAIRRGSATSLVPARAGLPVEVAVPTELVSLSAWHWTIVHPGQTVPLLPDPVLIRPWPG